MRRCLCGVDIRDALDEFDRDLADDGTFCAAAAAYYDQTKSTSAFVGVFMWREKVRSLIERIESVPDSGDPRAMPDRGVCQACGEPREMSRNIGDDGSPIYYDCDCHFPERST